MFAMCVASVWFNVVPFTHSGPATGKLSEGEALGGSAARTQSRLSGEITGARADGSGVSATGARDRRVESVP